jgi:CSLREA domain-containing protein
MKGLRRAVEMMAFYLSRRALACTVACAAMLLAPASAHSATITVNSTADTAANDGACTLREAIIAANTNTASGAAAGECAAGAAGLDTIAFAIPGAGVKTITPASPLPAITEAVFINGYTQPGSSPNTNALNAGINAVLLIELNGDTAGGLHVNAAGSVIRGLNVHGLVGDQIEVNASNVTLAGNFLGTNPAGTAATGGGGSGIRLTSGDNVVIGGAAAADRNLVSGDTGGSVVIFLLSGDGALIQGNYIGTDVTGTLALNATVFNSPSGIWVHSPTSNTTILGNLISGNSGGGMEMSGVGGVIQGNLIGTQRDGVSALGNLNDGGISLIGNGYAVGGTGSGQGNTIAFNVGGVHIVDNFVGDSILGNSIFSNGVLLGIRLHTGTPLANDACDVDTLPGNQGQNYPVITSAPIAAGNVTISGTLNSTASTTFRIEFFSNVIAHPSGNGEGKTFIGFANVTTDGSCNVSFGPLVFAVPPGQTIFSATATDPANNTSEFAVAFPIAAPPTPTPTVTPTATPTGSPTVVPTATPTPIPGGSPGASSVPALTDGMLAFLALALVGAALLLLKRAA